MQRSATRQQLSARPKGAHNVTERLPRHFRYGFVTVVGPQELTSAVGLLRLPLIERKRLLRSLVPPQPSRLLYVDHIDGHGVELFREVCRQDLEGVVAKRRDSVYTPEAPTWVKIKNPADSQAVGRHERFERMRATG